MELFRALATFAESPRAEAARVAEALGLGGPPRADEFTELFVFQFYPYASVYLGAEGMLGGEARDRVAGFWRALGHAPPAEPDHLSAMLALYARLCELEAEERGARRRGGWRGARRAFLWEHLLSWLPAYLDRVAESPSDFYRRWAGLLSDALAEEAEAAGRQDELSAHLRAAPPPSDPRAEGFEKFLESLLAPARCGVILTRADLARAARDLTLGARAGERRFALRSLFEQDAPAVTDWLAREAGGRARRHDALAARFGPPSAWWRGRALDAAALLAELRDETTNDDSVTMK